MTEDIKKAPYFTLNRLETISCFSYAGVHIGMPVAACIGVAGIATGVAANNTNLVQTGVLALQFAAIAGGTAFIAGEVASEKAIKDFEAYKPVNTHTRAKALGIAFPIAMSALIGMTADTGAKKLEVQTKNTPALTAKP